MVNYAIKCQTFFIFIFVVNYAIKYQTFFVVVVILVVLFLNVHTLCLLKLSMMDIFETPPPLFLLTYFGYQEEYMEVLN